MHTSLPTCEQHIGLLPSSYGASESLIWRVLNEINCPGENSVSCSHHFSLSGASTNSLLKRRRNMEVLSLLGQSAPTYILRRHKAVLYPPLVWLVLDRENSHPSQRTHSTFQVQKPDRHTIGGAMTIQHPASCICRFTLFTQQH